MTSWLTPEVVAILVSALGSLATWTYHKVKGDRTDAFDDVIRGLGKQAIHELLDDPKVASELTAERLQARAEEILTRLARAAKINTDSAIVQQLIVATAAHVVGDVQAALRKLDDANDQLSQLTSTISQFPAQLAKIEADAFARGKAWAAQNVEIVPVEGAKP